MRQAATIKFIVDQTIKQSGGSAPFEIAAQDQAEADAFAAALRGRHGTRCITVRVFPPAFFLALEDRP